MHTRLSRLAVTVVAVASLTGCATRAQASVFGSCTIARCSDARSANAIWAGKGYPTASGWYPWPDGRSNFTGGRFFNREGELPGGGAYNEYDVYSRTEGAHRDAYRIVVNRGSGAVWFSPNHYTDFYRL